MDEHSKSVYLCQPTIMILYRNMTKREGWKEGGGMVERRQEYVVDLFAFFLYFSDRMDLHSSMERSSDLGGQELKSIVRRRSAGLGFWMDDMHGMGRQEGSLHLPSSIFHLHHSFSLYNTRYMFRFLER